MNIRLTRRFLIAVFVFIAQIYFVGLNDRISLLCNAPLSQKCFFGFPVFIILLVFLTSIFAAFFDKVIKFDDWSIVKKRYPKFSYWYTIIYIVGVLFAILYVFGIIGL